MVCCGHGGAIGFGMDGVKVISLDAEGTLVSTRFSQVIWHEAIPALYARERNLSLGEAKKEVSAAYDEVGDQRIEWYDIKYWFSRFGLRDHQALLDAHRHEISVYEEVPELLPQLAERYELVVISNSTAEFLGPLLEPLR